MTLRRILWVAIALIVPILAALVGCIAGDRLFVATAEFAEEWQPLGRPPEPVTEIAAAHFETIWVRTVTGKLYSCYWVSPYDNECWAEETAVSDDPWSSWASSEVYDGPHYPGFEPIQESVAKHYSLRFPAAVKYVLFTDGTVRKWMYGGFLIFRTPGLQARYFGSLFGLGLLSYSLGLVVSIAIVKRMVLNTIRRE
jgi:hypothetical protein